MLTVGKITGFHNLFTLSCGRVGRQRGNEKVVHRQVGTRWKTEERGRQVDYS